jgi:hypothetical protein
VGRKGRGRWRSAAGIAAAPVRRSRGEEEERKGEEERLTGGAQLSASVGIKEKEEEGDGPLREGVDGLPS